MASDGTSHAGPLVRRASRVTVADLFDARARVSPDRVAVEDASRVLTYGELARRTKGLARSLADRGVARGERICVLSENRVEYLEVFLAAARLGAIVACPSWRLAAPELLHCFDLVEPVVTFVSPRHQGKLPGRFAAEPIVFGPDHERLTATDAASIAREVDPEDPLLILYTSGTTGMPKGAVRRS
jgi:acyl-CoA synthetase (AMP-forming)/AMP-acid ligase II